MTMHANSENNLGESKTEFVRIFPISVFYLKEKFSQMKTFNLIPVYEIGIAVFNIDNHLVSNLFFFVKHVGCKSVAALTLKYPINYF